MINIGIVGLGFMAATHIKGYQKLPNARIAALCSPSGRNLDGDFSKVSGNVGDKTPLRIDVAGVKAYRDFAALLADPEIDVIDLCTPTPTHADLAVAALASGKHVLCEKPLGRTPADARRIAEAAATAKGFFMPSMCIRFWPEYAWVKQAIDDGRFGKVLAARFRRVTEAPAWGTFLDGAKSGGALLDLHIHDVDFAQHCFGKPSSVLAVGYTKVSGEIDHAMALWRYKDGPAVQIEGGWAMASGFGFHMGYTVNFERATVDFDCTRGADAFKVSEAGKPQQTLTLEPTDGYTEELRYFLKCIESGQRPTRVTAPEAALAVELCVAEAESIRIGQVVEVG
jgi:predicted dehydrogenase